MPTVGWIQESDTNRLTDAFPFKREKPQPIRCQLCGQFVADAKALSSHLGTAHPLKQPIVRIGREVGTQFTVRDASLLKSVELHHVSVCSVESGGNGPCEVAPPDLGSHLQSSRNTLHRVRLRNDRDLDGRSAEIEVTIRVAIPDPGQLAQVDQLFQQKLAVERPTVADVSDFVPRFEGDTAIHEYAGALGDYVLGILIKEQDPTAGTTAAFAAHKAKLSSARTVLDQFQTRLAESVVAAIDFNLNNFWPDAQLAVPSLQAGHRFFTPFFTESYVPSSAATRAPESSDVAACPVDHMTAAILDFVAEFPRRPSSRLEEGEVAGGRRYPVSEFDRPKIDALLAASAMLVPDRKAAVRHLRALVHDHRFGAWATKQLESLSSDE